MAMVQINGQWFRNMELKILPEVHRRLQKIHDQTDNTAFSTTLNQVLKDYFLLLDLKEEIARQQ